jgi:hypothetical protein
MELFQNLNQLFTEGAQASGELVNLYKERTAQNTELYLAMSKLTASEFDRTYASLKRGANQQIRHELGQDNKDRGDCYDGDYGYSPQCHLETNEKEGARDSTCDSPCSCDQFLKLSAKVDEIGDKLCQSLQSHEAAIGSETTHNTPAKPPSSFWKRIFRHSARP